MKTRLPGLALVAVLLGSPAVPVAAQDSEVKEDKAEKERRKKEEKAAQKDAKESKEAKELLDEIQPDMDDFARGLIEKQYQDRFLQDYVNEMGQSLVPREATPGLHFSFRVIDDPTPNALALPDGRVYVSSGLLVFVRNEAQLAMVLGHEIGHVVEQHQVEAIKESRSFKKKLLPGLLGGLAGAALGAIVKGKEGAATGAAIGAGAGVVYSVVALNSYNRKQEDEADTVGTRLMLTRGFDAKEGIPFFQRLAEKFGDKDRFSNLLWGNHSRNEDRANHIRALLDGELASVYNAQRSAGNLTLGTGQMSLYTSGMLREVAIQLMLHEDRYDIAKELLDSIIDYRARDPRALWAIGCVYKMVGRTPEDKAKALDYLQRAAQVDERNMHPYVYRDLGLMQARLASSGNAGMAPAVESLKKYVRGWMDKYYAYPYDIEEMYDYLLIFGDSKWTAPKIEGLVLRASGPGGSGPIGRPSTPSATEAAKAMLPNAAPNKKKPAGVAPKND